MERSAPGRVLLVFFAILLALIVVLPMLYQYGAFTGLDGKAGVIDNWSSLGFADPLTRSIYTLGDLFCHQETARSFIINGSQTAFCHRDVSVLIGLVSGLFVTDLFSKRIYAGDKKFAISGAVMFISTFVEWAVEFVSGIDIPAVRIATGVLAGIGLAMVLQYAFTREYEKVMGFEKGV
jgi:uncharacterized membrane protein